MTVSWLEGRVALVTGATSGIGEVTARRLATGGARVVLTGRRTELGEAIADDIVNTGGDAHFVTLDVGDPAAVHGVIHRLVDELGSLDIAFNNAGIFDRMQEFHSYPDEAWDEMISVNFSGVFRCMREELAAMVELPRLEVGDRVIVNNASTVSFRGSLRASPAYVAAKHAVLGLTRQAGLEYVDRGIRSVAVAPGPTRTPVAQPLVDEGPDAVAAALGSLNPRADFVAPDDVAETVLWLCSPAASMINACAVPLDGGQLGAL